MERLGAPWLEPSPLMEGGNLCVTKSLRHTQVNRSVLGEGLGTSGSVIHAQGGTVSGPGPGVPDMGASSTSTAP